MHIMMISTYVLIPNYLNFKKSLHEQGIGIKMHFSMEQPVSKSANTPLYMLPKS